MISSGEFVTYRTRERHRCWTRHAAIKLAAALITVNEGSVDERNISFSWKPNTKVVQYREGRRWVVELQDRTP